MFGAGSGWRQSGSKRGEGKKLGVHAKGEQSTLKRGFPGRVRAQGDFLSLRAAGDSTGKRVHEVPLPGAKGTKAVPRKLGDLMAWSEGRKNRFVGDE